ncbi:hypothetical protein P0Y35_00700 [Kiritimatiellaeota bacterium B1221]|nr:hypothetical protein [Kiritimatiellaeota bacterium B1221]
MFDKIKAVLVILIVGYVGYMGWETYKGKPLFKPSILSPDTDAGKRSTEEERDVLVDGPAPMKLPQVGGQTEEALSPLQEIHRELNQIEASLYKELDGESHSKTNQLKGLWKRSQAEFKRGTVSEQDAKILSAVISSLNNISKERELYVQRFNGLDEIKGAAMETGITAKEKRKFAEEQLNRQWSEWVVVNRAGTRRMLNALSE